MENGKIKEGSLAFDLILTVFKLTTKLKLRISI